MSPLAIIIVRDPSVREELGTALQRQGFTVRSAHQGEGWSTLFEPGPPRLVLVPLQGSFLNLTKVNMLKN